MQSSERKHPLAQCEQCPLREGSAYVPSTMPDKPRLVIVGEAPGYYETTSGRPFTGPSGQLLDNVLSHYGYSRSEVMFTNVTSCRPEHNATPPKAAVVACRERLLAEITESGADSVVALGGTAAAALIDDPRTISSLRVGPPKTPTRGLATSSVERVVPTWHPAYCLRNADAFPSMVRDFGKLQGSKREPWKAPDWAYFEETPLALAAIEELRQFEHLVVDIEVGIEKDTEFDHPNNYDMLCVGIAYAKGKAVVIGEEPLKDMSVRVALQSLFAKAKLIAHNGKFDLAGLYPLLGPLKLWFDTMLASYCLDERPGNHGLKVRAVEDLGAPQYDLEIKKYVPKGGSYANIPRQLLYKYNAYDVACTFDLYEMFVPRLESVPGLRSLHDFLVEASNELMFLELNGITVDRTYQNILRAEFAKRLEDIESKLDEIISDGVYEGTLEGEVATAGASSPTWIKHINPRSPKQIKEYLTSQGIAVESTNQDTLERLVEFLQTKKGLKADEPIIKFLTTLLIHRRQQKLSSTYVDGIRKRMYRGRVYTTYMLHGTTSGRLASRNPNLQNIVRDKSIRRQFSVAHPDNVFIQADFKQAEGRVITTLAQDEYLRNIFSNPAIDMFNELSDQLYGPGNWGKEERIRTKAFFYGIGYGREPYSIGLEYGMSPREAERRYQEFMDLIPAVAQWQQGVRRRVLAGEDLVTSFGRRRRFFLINDQNKKEVLNEALSFLPQSTSSDICLTAFIRLRPMLRGLGHIRLTIHDALVVECPEVRQVEVSRLLVAEMERAGREWTDYVPFTADVSFGKNWGDL